MTKRTWTSPWKSNSRHGPGADAPGPVHRALRWGRHRGGLAFRGALLAGALALLAPAPAPAEPTHVPIPGGLGGKTCYECHVLGDKPVLESAERPRRYSLAGAFETYLESPHGRLRRLGDQRAPMCEDCHFTREWSEILPRENPDSPINPRNLPRVCARCHGKAMLTAKVTEGSMHLELSHRSLAPGTPLSVRYGFLPGLTKAERHYYIGPFDVTAYVSVFFLLITVGTLGVFAMYMVADLVRKLLERRSERETAQEQPEPQPEQQDE